jgi:hypothetical protein
MITLDDNKSIMKTCQAFIRESHRFPWLQTPLPPAPTCAQILEYYTWPTILTQLFSKSKYAKYLIS